MDLPTAKSQRAALVQRMHAFTAWSESDAMKALDFFGLKAKLDRYEENFKNLERSNAIVAGAAETPELCAEIWTEFHGLEDSYATAYANVSRRFVELTPAVGVAGTGQAETSQAGNVPQQQQQPIIVQMPFQPHHVQEVWGTFDGDLLKWQEFRARFELAVHDRPEIPIEYKFSYLRNSLSGKAAEAARGWVLKPENYAKVWDELVSKNERRYPLACAYLSRFFANKRLDAHTTPDALQHLVNEANVLVRQLTDMNYPVDRMDLIIVHAIQERLNKFYAEKWEVERNGCDEPSVEQMTKFLEGLATRSANHGLAYAPAHVAGANERPQRPQLQSTVHRPQQSERNNESQVYPCAACNSKDHLVFKCPDFKPLSLSERMKVVLHNRMCMNCLKRGHQKDNCHDQHRCQLPQCREDNRHNSMLCPYKNAESHAMIASHDDHPRSSNDDRYRSRSVQRRLGKREGTST